MIQTPHPFAATTVGFVCGFVPFAKEPQKFSLLRYQFIHTEEHIRLVATNPRGFGDSETGGRA